MTFVLSLVCFDADRPAKCGSDSHTHTHTHVPTQQGSYSLLRNNEPRRESPPPRTSLGVGRLVLRYVLPNAAAFWALSPRIYPLHPGLLTASLLKSLGQNSGHDRQEFLVPSHLRIFVYYCFFLLRFKATIR